MTLLSRTLCVFYLALPVVAVGLAVWRSRRRPRSDKPIVALLLTCASAIVLGPALVAAYAWACRGWPTVGQVALTAYLTFGVLALLKGLNWLLAEGMGRLFFVIGRHRRGGATLGPRAVGASAGRAVVLTAVGLPYVMALGMIYRPKIASFDDPGPASHFQHVTFRSTDGIPLDAWWIPAHWTGRPGSAPPARFGRDTVILCHGLGANKANQLIVARDLLPNGYNVLTFDFRAHGASGGQLSSFGDLERRDVLGAVRWALQAHPQQTRRVLGLGISMGGAALIAAAADPSPEGQRIDAVAVYDTYDNLGSTASDLIDQHFAPPLAWLIRRVAFPIASAHVGADLERFSPARLVDRIAPRPLLVIHARGDEVIPFSHGVALYDAASEPKLRCWIGKRKIDSKDPTGGAWVDSNDIPADHNGVILSSEASAAVLAFFDWARPVL